MHVGILLACLVLVATISFATAATAASDTSGSSPPVTAIWLKTATAYTPKAPAGATDDYHCSVLNPHVDPQFLHHLQANSSLAAPRTIMSPSTWYRHRLRRLLSKTMCSTRVGRASAKGHCQTPLQSDFRKVPTLSTWTPGHGADDLPKGTGIAFPPGSLLVMQVHYNLLVGDKPVKNSLVIHTVPMSTPLLPLRRRHPARLPDIPCPTGITGPLCNRAASLADQGQRFGQTAVATVEASSCFVGAKSTDPPAGDSTSCTSPMDTSGYIVRLQPHMHLLGVGFTMVLNPGTPEAKTVLTVPNYDFHHQRAYNLVRPVRVTAGEPVEITCTYDPTLAQELPILRKAPPHFVTWGDGSTDEMCVDVVWTSATPPNSHDSV